MRMAGSAFDEKRIRVAAILIDRVANALSPGVDSDGAAMEASSRRGGDSAAASGRWNRPHAEMNNAAFGVASRGSPCRQVRVASKMPLHLPLFYYEDIYGDTRKTHLYVHAGARAWASRSGHLRKGCEVGGSEDWSLSNRARPDSGNDQ